MLTWDDTHRSYRDSVTDELLGHVELTALRNAYAVQQGERVDSLVDNFLAGASDADVWSLAFQELIIHMLITGYAFGRGGVAQMTDADYDHLAAATEQQLAYAERFRGDIVRGEVSPEQLRTRAKLYTGASVRMYEEGRAAAHDRLVLPAYPGDTECMANCRCTWIIVDTGDTWECTWALEPGSDHCDDCRNNANVWAPYVVMKGTG